MAVIIFTFPMLPPLYKSRSASNAFLGNDGSLINSSCKNTTLCTTLKKNKIQNELIIYNIKVMINVETYLDENIKHLLYYVIYLSHILKFQFSCNLFKYFCLCCRSYLNTF